MLYRKNMGSREGWVRVIGGTLIVACFRKSLEGPR
jgi:hypothetical protein